MKTIEVSLIRDLNDLLFIFAEKEQGQGVPEPLMDFGRTALHSDIRLSVVIRGPGRDKMPCLAAADLCRDYGYDVEFIGFEL